MSLEVSRDGMGSLPVAAPQTTCAFTTIKLQLVKPEVVNAVTVRLHRPLDSSSLGLSQIRLMGTSAFSENSVSCGAVANDDAVSSTRCDIACRSFFFSVFDFFFSATNGKLKYK